MRTPALALPVVLWVTLASAGEYLIPDFNNESEARSAVMTLHKEIGQAALTKEAKGYAAHCDTAIRRLESDVQIYGAPSKDELVGAWHTCKAVHERITLRGQVPG